MDKHKNTKNDVFIFSPQSVRGFPHLFFLFSVVPTNLSLNFFFYYGSVQQHWVQTACTYVFSVLFRWEIFLLCGMNKPRFCLVSVGGIAFVSFLRVQCVVLFSLILFSRATRLKCTHLLICCDVHSRASFFACNAFDFF